MMLLLLLAGVVLFALLLAGVRSAYRAHEATTELLRIARNPELPTPPAVSPGGPPPWATVETSPAPPEPPRRGGSGGPHH